MRISVFGIGYVGCVSAACLAQDGHQVIGVDVNSTKVDILNSGSSPIIEPGIAALIAEAHAAGRLEATRDSNLAVKNSSISLVCVGTPSNPNGSLDLQYVNRVCEEIGAALRNKSERHVVVIRSTVLPGTLEKVVIPVLEECSGLKAGEGFGVAMNPEFLREGSSLKDYYSPPFTLIGADDEETATAIQKLYSRLAAPLFVTSLRTAAMVKYVSNSFHALKVSFANEVGNVCKGLGVDSHEVMNIFCEDTKLNLSPYYLKPGFAFGGSCLPKDLRAFGYKAREIDVETPVLNAILSSNRLQVERAVDMVVRSGKKRVGVLGFSFKAGTDDLRESPLVTLIETLIGKGFQVKLFDRDVSLARLMGANKEYIEREIPHIAQLMCESVGEVIEASELVVIGNKSDEFATVLKDHISAGKLVIDLVRLFEAPPKVSSYEGICW